MSNIKQSILKYLHYLGLAFGMNRNFLSVLCYHSISSSSDKYATSLSEFKKQINLVKNHAKFIDAKKLEGILDGKQIKDWEVLLTFDDGYIDIKKIIPLTKELNIPVILFVLSNPAKANRKELANNHKLLTFGEIKKLHKLGWTIGCHSATHADLSNLNEAGLYKEIKDSKKTLEKKLGFKINYFAYPKGIVNNHILEAVKKAGFKLAFTTGPGVINSKTNPLLIPRTVIDKSRDTSSFPYFLSETGVFLRSVIETIGSGKILTKFQA